MITAAESFLNSVLSANNPFVESISYTPTGANAKTINATVKRGMGSISRQHIDSRTIYAAEILISNDTTSGVAKVTPRKDTVTMAAPELDSTSHVFTVAGIIGKSAMGWHLGLNQ